MSIANCLFARSLGYRWVQELSCDSRKFHPGTTRTRIGSQDHRLIGRLVVLPLQQCGSLTPGQQLLPWLL
jgi:hypothetical protein